MYINSFRFYGDTGGPLHQALVRLWMCKRVWVCVRHFTELYRCCQSTVTILSVLARVSAHRNVHTSGGRKREKVDRPNFPHSRFSLRPFISTANSASSPAKDGLLGNLMKSWKQCLVNCSFTYKLWSDHHWCLCATGERPAGYPIWRHGLNSHSGLSAHKWNCINATMSSEL